MGVGKVPGETERELQESMEGNHDNPVSGTTRHHHTENLGEGMRRYLLRQTSKGEERLGAKKS